MELFLVFLIVVLILYLEYLPFTLKTLGLLYFIRSFFIVLTPLGNRPDQVLEITQDLFSRLAYSNNDFFFSGHVALPFMLMFLFWDKNLVRTICFGATLLFASAVLLAHTHYSIDVFSVFFMIPTVFGLSRFLFARDVEYLHVDYTKDHTTHVPPLL
jgi:hypothetical protein